MIHSTLGRGFNRWVDDPSYFNCRGRPWLLDVGEVALRFSLDRVAGISANIIPIAFCRLNGRCNTAMIDKYLECARRKANPRILFSGCFSAGRESFGLINSEGFVSSISPIMGDDSR